MHISVSVFGYNSSAWVTAPSLIYHLLPENAALHPPCFSPTPCFNTGLHSWLAGASTWQKGTWMAEEDKAKGRHTHQAGWHGEPLGDQLPSAFYYYFITFTAFKRIYRKPSPFLSLSYLRPQKQYQLQAFGRQWFPGTAQVCKKLCSQETSLYYIMETFLYWRLKQSSNAEEELK